MHVRWLRLACLFLLAIAPVTAQQPALVNAERIADGVLLYRLDDPGLLTPPGPVAIQAMRLDPRKVILEMQRGGDRMPERETVDRIAERHGAVAAVNAGFFSIETGAPTALLKIRGRVMSGTSRTRGAVGIADRRGVTRLLFDRVAVENRTGRRHEYRTVFGSPASEWARVRDAVGGAGLLVLDGRELQDWTDERLSTGFETTRHPRTLIGVGRDDAIWLVTIDGRNPALSLGMTFAEMQALSRSLGLRSALNLDGGGSTTMVAAGQIVNHPSDPGGPRKVSDAILVRTRRK